MSSAWRHVSLDEVCDKPTYGLIARATDERIGPPFVRQTDIVSGDIDWDSVPFCKASDDDFKKYGLHEGDLLISRLGAGVGTAAHVSQTGGAVFAGYLVRFQANPAALFHGFAKYVLHSGQWWQYVNGTKSGAAQPTLNAKQMGRFGFLLPPLDEQRRIAGVLSALDDLIDTNRRLQRQLNHQRAALMQREVDQAEEFTSFGKIAELVRETTSPQNVQADTAYLGLEHFTENANGLVGVGTVAGLDSVKTRFKPGDLLYGKLRPYFRKVSRPNFGGICSTEIWVLRPRVGVDAEYLEWVASNQQFTDFAMAGSSGTRMPRARWDHVQTFPVANPSARELSAVCNATSAMWQQYWTLEEECHQLVEARDELLPLLVSGRIRVSGLTL